MRLPRRQPAALLAARDGGDENKNHLRGPSSRLSGMDELLDSCTLDGKMIPLHRAGRLMEPSNPRDSVV
jgi:hypothetical protein